ncbi:hypothetical protein T07_14095 [Trichinella nelsoni]|uniref:Uncharacterized protein n=1 Tax=Trichinella nelsoni TaxID=6336 RepID=A0A0V0SJQ9_9BILA|nr:hypothetical protein T07_14095 [Trichinella nelsoni]
MKQRKSENADDTKQITDATKKNNRKQQVNVISSLCLFYDAVRRSLLNFHIEQCISPVHIRVYPQ